MNNNDFVASSSLMAFGVSRVPITVPSPHPEGERLGLCIRGTLLLPERVGKSPVQFASPQDGIQRFLIELEHVTIISNATGVPAAKYDRFAEFLVRARFGKVGVLTYDYSGMGASVLPTWSSKPKDRIAETQWISLETWKGDLDAVFAWLLHNAGIGRTGRADGLSQPKVCHIGHSVGGHLVPITNNAGQCLSRCIMVSAQSAYWGYASVSRTTGKVVESAIADSKFWRAGYQKTSREFSFLTWHVMLPFLCRYYGYFPSKKIGLQAEFLPRNIGLNWAKWARQPGYTLDKDWERENLERAQKHFNCPTLVIFSFDDEFIRRGHAQMWEAIQKSKCEKQHAFGNTTSGELGKSCVSVDAIPLSASSVPPEILDLHQPLGAFGKEKVEFRVLHKRGVLDAKGNQLQGEGDAPLGHNGWLFTSDKAVKECIWGMMADFLYGGNGGGGDGECVISRTSRL